MDPASALALACNAFELTGIAIKLGRNAYQLYKSGRLVREDEQLARDSAGVESVATRVQDRLNTLRSLGDSLSQEQLHLQRAAHEAVDASCRLQSLLNELARGSRKRDMFRKLASRPFKSDEIAAARTEVERCHRLLDTHFITSLSTQVDVNDARQREILYQMDRNIAFQGESASLQLQSITTLLSELRVSEERRHEDLKRIEQQLANSEKQKAFDRLVESLSFTGYAARENQISLPHSGTCEWIFDEKTFWDREETGFPAWLSSNDAEIFWVKGKAGCGKSTLMKHIAESPRLETALRLWTGSGNLIVLRHYFWRAGSSEQASLSGMLRTLLVQLLRSSHDAARGVLHVPDVSHSDWSLTPLQTSFSTMIESLLETSFVVVILDGLDEFVGTHGEQRQLLEMFKDISTRHRAKVCVSSRPEQHLVHSLEGYPQVDVKDFTFTDMRRFVDGELGAYDLFAAMRREDFDRTDVLSHDLVLKAEGVFQWLHYAVEDIADGLRGSDSLDELFERLDSLPRTLDEFYELFLKRIPRNRRKDAAKMIIMTTMNQIGEKLVFSVLDMACVVDASIGSTLTSRSECSEELFSRLLLFSKTSIPSHSAGFLECEFRDSDRSSGPHCRPEERLLANAESCRCENFYQAGGRISVKERISIHFGSFAPRFHHRSAMDFFAQHKDGIAFLREQESTPSPPQLIIDVHSRRYHIVLSYIWERLRPDADAESSKSRGLISTATHVRDGDSETGYKYRVRNNLFGPLRSLILLIHDANHRECLPTVAASFGEILLQSFRLTSEIFEDVFVAVENLKTNADTSKLQEIRDHWEPLESIKEIHENFRRGGDGFPTAINLLFQAMHEATWDFEDFRQAIGTIYIDLITQSHPGPRLLRLLDGSTNFDLWKRKRVIQNILAVTQYYPGDTRTQCRQFIFDLLDQNEEIRQDVRIGCHTGGVYRGDGPGVVKEFDISMWVSPIVMLELDAKLSIATDDKEAVLRRMRSIGLDRHAEISHFIYKREAGETVRLDLELLTTEQELDCARLVLLSQARPHDLSVSPLQGLRNFQQQLGRQGRRPEPNRRRRHSLTSV